jgi:hypothetical protein
MKRFALELYFENEDEHDCAEWSRVGLLELVDELAPHLTLAVLVREAHQPRRKLFAWGHRNVPYHDPSSMDRQALLITSEEIGAAGWGWPRRGVVSKSALLKKRANGGKPADIMLRVWLQTLEGVEINGNRVPFVDSAKRMGYSPTTGPDGEGIWHAWYRYALGGVAGHTAQALAHPAD